MRITRSVRTRVAVTAFALAVSGILAAPAAAVAGTDEVRVGRFSVPEPAACTTADITVRKGRLEGAAGSRFQVVRVTNNSAQACQSPGWTRYRFVRHGIAIGWRSDPNPGMGSAPPPVVITAGATVRSVLSWVDPGPVPRHKCHARHATAFRMRIAGLPGFYRLSLRAPVCTTKKYRPHGTRLGD